MALMIFISAIRKMKLMYLWLRVTHSCNLPIYMGNLRSMEKREFTIHFVSTKFCPNSPRPTERELNSCWSVENRSRGTNAAKTWIQTYHANQLCLRCFLNQLLLYNCAFTCRGWSNKEQFLYNRSTLEALLSFFFW